MCSESEIRGPLGVSFPAGRDPAVEKLVPHTKGQNRVSTILRGPARVHPTSHKESDLCQQTPDLPIRKLVDFL